MKLNIDLEAESTYDDEYLANQIRALVIDEVRKAVRSIVINQVTKERAKLVKMVEEQYTKSVDEALNKLKK